MFSLNYRQIIHKGIMTKEQLNKELTAAAASGDAAGLRAALAAGAEVDARGSVATALMMAARHGHAACVKLLLEAGADVHAHAYGVGSLEWAAGGGHAECVELLLAAGAVGDGGRWEEGCTKVDPHWVDEELMDVYEDGGTYAAAMMWAVQYDHAECLKLLCEGRLRTADDDFMGYVLAWAVDVGSVDCLKWQLCAESGVEYTSQQLDFALKKAAWHGDVTCVELLLEAGADVPDDEELADICETLADDGGNEDCLSLLRAAEAAPKHVLAKAAQRGDAEEVLRCLSAGAGATAVGRALFPAAEGGHAACVKLLLEAGANVKEKSEWGYTCLMLAARGGAAECVRLLLVAGADANAVAADDWSSLMFAAERGDAECVKLLIDAGADVNAEDCSGYSVVMRAAEKGHMECLKLLFAAGASTRGLASVLRCQPSEFSGENG